MNCKYAARTQYSPTDTVQRGRSDTGELSLSGHIMCGSMVDIQSETAGFRRGKKKDRTNYRAKYNVCVACARQGAITIDST